MGILLSYQGKLLKLQAWFHNSRTISLISALLILENSRYLLLSHRSPNFAVLFVVDLISDGHPTRSGRASLRTSEQKTSVVTNNVAMGNRARVNNFEVRRSTDP